MLILIFWFNCCRFFFFIFLFVPVFYTSAIIHYYYNVIIITFIASLLNYYHYIYCQIGEEHNRLWRSGGLRWRNRWEGDRTDWKRLTDWSREGDDYVSLTDTSLLCSQSVTLSISHAQTLSLSLSGDLTAIRDAGPALEVLDIDGDGVIGLLDFIHFAARLKAIHQVLFSTY